MSNDVVDELAMSFAAVGLAIAFAKPAITDSGGRTTFECHSPMMAVLVLLRTSFALRATTRAGDVRSEPDLPYHHHLPTSRGPSTFSTRHARFGTMQVSVRKKKEVAVLSFKDGGLLEPGRSGRPRS